MTQRRGDEVGTMAEGLKSVLVVDDDPEECWALDMLLSREGFRVTTAGSGGEALKRLEAGVFDLVLVDAKLGDMEGADLARRIRSATSCTAPLVLISGYFDRYDRLVQDWLRAGLFVAFVAKPFLHADLCQTIRQALSTGEHPTTMAASP